MNEPLLASTPKGDILLVDDVLTNLQLLARLLKQQGHKVRSATNGPTALRAALAKPPNLILLDINMPEMNGYEVCEQLKTNPQTQDIPVIFLSAHDEAMDKVRGFRVGGVDYITKPFQVEEVLIRVENHLALRKAQQEISHLNAELENRVRKRTQQLEAANQELQQEIQRRQQAQQQLLEMALKDSLTGLPNRTLFIKHLEEALSHCQAQPSYRFAVLFLDCDRFKKVNDSFGHVIGDELLIVIGKRLQQVLERFSSPACSLQIQLARLGGDEFAVLLEKMDNFSQATEMAEAILQAFGEPFWVAERDVYMNTSIGIAYGDNRYQKPEYILRDADVAMYQAKELGKGQYRIFDIFMRRRVVEFLQVETEIRKAIHQGQMLPYYQPIICLKSGKLIGFETLLRWQHPEKGLLLPGEFVQVAEETGAIVSIDRQILAAACQQMARWYCLQPEGNGTECNGKICVNLSAWQFSQPDLLSTIDRVLLESRLPPACLTLEITESLFMENRDRAKTILNSLKERGIQISIDDFGTGYSSLSYLQEFPVDVLKIDKSFIQQLSPPSGHIEEAPTGIVPAIINMAHTMGMTVVGEGIETYQQLEKLQALQCDYGQGFWFSPPVDAEAAVEMAASGKAWELPRQVVENYTKK
jgi:diguanylate cyclase (GGDEF)-like protein